MVNPKKNLEIFLRKWKSSTPDHSLGLQGFPYRGDGGIPPCRLGPPQKFSKIWPPCANPKSPPKFFRFHAVFGNFCPSLSPKSHGKPWARNWYTHWSGDLPQLQGSIFWFFFFLSFTAFFRVKKSTNLFFDPKNGQKKYLKTKKSKIWPLRLWRVTRPMCVPTLALGSDLVLSFIFDF